MTSVTSVIFNNFYVKTSQASLENKSIILLEQKVSGPMVGSINFTQSFVRITLAYFLYRIQ